MCRGALLNVKPRGFFWFFILKLVCVTSLHNGISGISPQTRREKIHVSNGLLVISGDILRLDPFVSLA
jgi:hypothetical protein